MMNIVLWVLQVVLSLHTIMGAVWKFSNSAQGIPSLRAISPEVWLGLSMVEFLCAGALILPVIKRFGIAALIYWLLAGVIRGFIAYSRFILRPIKE